MTGSFINRVDRLIETVETEKARRSDPMAVDGLSRSLYELGAELAALDDVGVMVEAERLEIAPDDVRNMAQSFRRPLWC